MASRHYGEFEILDYSAERSSFSFNFGAITALSLPGFLTQFGALRTALDAITIGTLSKEKWVGDETFLSNVAPLVTTAQREIYWRVYYGGTEGSRRLHHTDIACPDASLLIAGTDRADLAAPDMAAFVTAFEAIAIDPDDEEAGAIVAYIEFRGRRH